MKTNQLTSLLILLFLFYSAKGQVTQNSASKKIYTTKSIKNLDAPNIDGSLDEEIWNTVEWTGDFIENDLRVGPIPILPTDMNDEGSVIIGRAGSFFTGFAGAMWIEGIGWMSLENFFRKQGVTEAFEFPMDNPISIDGSGSKMVGGLAGATFSWHVEMQHVYVCDDGESVQVGFPNGLRNAMADGAEFGRCEFLD